MHEPPVLLPRLLGRGTRTGSGLLRQRRERKTQNLARIRDNQRRSRARRKEYLNELETKLRNCEQMGIEASAEIQNAARRVLDENRKLRSILHERGVSDNEIVAAMGGASDRSYDHISAAPSLSAMLDRRIACDGLLCTNSPSSRHSSLAGLNASHLPSVPPLVIPAPRSNAPLATNDPPSPHSIVSSMDTPPGCQGSPYYNSPMPPTPEIKSEEYQQYTMYDQSSFNNRAWSYSTEAQYVTEPASQYIATTSSCEDAATIIRTMRSDFGSGFINPMCYRVPGQSYEMNRHSGVFNAMDRYTSSQRG
ncbi:hypothetical protein CC80DRAFT_520875 [Byssothecium circinans]|uniref:BZIP domain-containing protein n=1 Tax=Byssothecium circinans TaxID=147558 RepID=A0A6A5TB39_9PLEO|nr:hypothetical protein CC80DRAFT_520875 [Byssothecium circinans]